MSDNSFDTLSKLASKSASRRQTLRAIAAGLGGVFLSTLLGGRTAFAAAPRTCASCICGKGKPCNAKGGATCTEFTPRQFPDAEAACTAACQQQGKFNCGGATQFHCPQGCPA
jgi:hypothetical protein